MQSSPASVMQKNYEQQTSLQMPALRNKKLMFDVCLNIVESIRVSSCVSGCKNNELYLMIGLLGYYSLNNLLQRLDLLVKLIIFVHPILIFR
jgi:hypothetical protein